MALVPIVSGFVLASLGSNQFRTEAAERLAVDGLAPQSSENDSGLALYDQADVVESHASMPSVADRLAQVPVWRYRHDLVRALKTVSVAELARQSDHDEGVSTMSTKSLGAGFLAPVEGDRALNLHLTGKGLNFEAPLGRSYGGKHGVEGFKCLADAIFFEARGETLAGQYAVAEVVINRLNSKKFPNTICGVVTQGGITRNRCQFSFYCDGKPDSIHETDTYAKVMKVAHNAITDNYRPLTQGSTYFHSLHVKPKWSDIFRHTVTVGNHKFYAN